MKLMHRSLLKTISVVLISFLALGVNTVVYAQKEEERKFDKVKNDKS